MLLLMLNRCTEKNKENCTFSASPKAGWYDSGGVESSATFSVIGLLEAMYQNRTLTLQGGDANFRAKMQYHVGLMPLLRLEQFHLHHFLLEGQPPAPVAFLRYPSCQPKQHNAIQFLHACRRNVSQHLKFVLTQSLQGLAYLFVILKSALLLSNCTTTSLVPLSIAL